jgi:hypothetical protein
VWKVSGLIPAEMRCKFIYLSVPSHELKFVNCAECQVPPMVWNSSSLALVTCRTCPTYLYIHTCHCQFAWYVAVEFGETHWDCEGNAELFHLCISLYLKVTAHIQLMIQIHKTCTSLNYCNSRKRCCIEYIWIMNMVNKLCILCLVFIVYIFLHELFKINA